MFEGATFSGADLATIIGAGVAAVAVIVGAYLQHRRGRADEVELVDVSIVRLHHDDRTAVTSLRDTAVSLRDVMLSLGRRVDTNTDALAENRRAVQDNTAERRRHP